MSSFTALQASDQERWDLAGLFVGAMAPTPPAVLVELDPIPVVVAIFRRYVVSPLAFGALERHVDAPITGHGSPHRALLEGGKYNGARTPEACGPVFGEAEAAGLGGGAGRAAEVRPLPERGPLRAPVHPGGWCEHRDGVPGLDAPGAGEFMLKGLPHASHAGLGVFVGRRWRRRRRSRGAGTRPTGRSRRGGGTLSCSVGGDRSGATPVHGCELCPSGGKSMINLGTELVH